MCANTAAAYEPMPTELKALADCLRIVHSKDSDHTDATVAQREELVCPEFRGVEILWISCHGDDAVPLELYGCEPSELAVTTLPVVPDLEVLEDRVS